ncbi:MAG: hypothetical protein MUF34_29345, partial [Polyangiaceae bacterium]|nr:hypothetical protein [Polyangiaceae bacterium]
MTVRRSAPASIIAACVVAVLAVTAVANLLTGRLNERSKESSFKLMRDVLGNTLNSCHACAPPRASAPRARGRETALARPSGRRDPRLARTWPRLAERGPRNGLKRDGDGVKRTCVAARGDLP